MVVAFLHGHVSVDGPPHCLKVHHRDHRLEQRGSHPSTDSCPLPLVERDQDADREVQARGQIAHGNARPRGFGPWQAGDAHQPAHALRDLVHAAPVRVRAVLAEARDRAVDQTRVARVHDLPPEAELVLHRRPHVLDEDVGAIGHAQQRLNRAVGLQVELDRALVAMEVACVASADSGRIRGWLDPNDVGAPVCELAHALRPGASDAQVDHPDVAEGEAHRPIFARAPASSLKPCPSGST